MPIQEDQIQEGIGHSMNRLLERLTISVALAILALVARCAVPTAPGNSGPLTGATPTSPPAQASTLRPVSTSTAPVTLSPAPTPTPALTPTATPTLPPTSTPKPTDQPPDALPAAPVILTATDSITRLLRAPTPMPLVEQPENALNILLLGSDQENDGSIGRTDTIVVASIIPDLPSVTLLSIPRDFYAWIPSHGFGKINTAFSRGVNSAYPGGGPELVKSAVEYNFGIPIHHFARVNFNAFTRIVDTLGGVDVAVECPLHDTFPDPHSPSGHTDVDWEPGIHHLDGKHALWYVRSRWSTSDFDRHRRQQQVLRSLYHQIMTLGIVPKIPSLWGALKENVSTDLGLSDLLYLGAIGSRLDTMNVRSRFLGQQILEPWTGPGGAYVLVPTEYQALSAAVKEALAVPAPARARQRAFRVEVRNATGHQGLGLVAGQRLRWEGFSVASVKQADAVYPRTRVVDLTTTAEGSPLPGLLQLYGRQPSDVVSQPTEHREVDFRIILGADYDPCAATKVH